MKPVDAITPSFFRHIFTTFAEPELAAEARASSVTDPDCVELFDGDVHATVGLAFELLTVKTEEVVDRPLVSVTVSS